MCGNDDLRIGDRSVPPTVAEAWVRSYTDAAANRQIPDPYSFPAYDHYAAESGPDQLSDGDLLAPVLLNVDVSVRSFYALQAVRPCLEEALRRIPHDLTLEAASPDRIRELVAPLYAVLDPESRRPHGVKATTLSKVLHRKRPHFLVLHDKQVVNCYRERLQIPTEGRSWAEYMVAVSGAVADDLRSQPAAWDRLAAAVGPQGLVSRVRMLDIVAWNAGREREGKLESRSSGEPPAGERGDVRVPLPAVAHSLSVGRHQHRGEQPPGAPVPLRQGEPGEEHLAEVADQLEQLVVGEVQRVLPVTDQVARQVDVLPVQVAVQVGQQGGDERRERPAVLLAAHRGRVLGPDDRGPAAQPVRALRRPADALLGHDLQHVPGQQEADLAVERGGGDVGQQLAQLRRRQRPVVEQGLHDAQAHGVQQQVGGCHGITSSQRSHA